VCEFVADRKALALGRTGDIDKDDTGGFLSVRN
jgi:hypothetical protein